jgi:molecular chaperone DnaK
MFEFLKRLYQGFPGTESEQTPEAPQPKPRKPEINKQNIPSDDPPWTPSKRIIGIDLGTTKSLVAIMEANGPKVIPNQEGELSTPSVVAFTEQGEILVGTAARRQAVINPRNTVYSIKRLMGRRHSEISSSQHYPYEIVGRDADYAKIKVGYHEYSPQEISAHLLRKLKDSAEAYLGQTVNSAVITVPSYFNDAQRQATRDAALIAGLKVMRIISEPTSAALAYGLNRSEHQKIAIYDLGGGTLDVSILELADGVFRVISTNGDTLLGGDDFDQLLMNHVADEFKQEHGIDLRRHPVALERVLEACESAKRLLSSMYSAEIDLPHLIEHPTKHLKYTITRGKFNDLVGPLVDRSRQIINGALKDAKLEPSQIDQVVLVGGSTRIPEVQRVVTKLFDRVPCQGVNPEEAVALGAGIHSGILEGTLQDMLLLDVTSISLGVEIEGGIFNKLVERNTTLPTEKKQVFSTAKDGQTEIIVSIFQGERPLARDNRLLDEFKLEGIPIAPRGSAKIEVKFDIDTNGIVNVTAKDLGTGKEKKISLLNSCKLPADEIRRMQLDAEAQIARAEQKRKLAAAIGHGESLCFEIEKQLKNGNWTDSPGAAVGNLLTKARDILASKDFNAIKSVNIQLEEMLLAINTATQITVCESTTNSKPYSDSGPEHSI